jgi:hypothetical protein
MENLKVLEKLLLMIRDSDDPAERQLFVKSAWKIIELFESCISYLRGMGRSVEEFEKSAVAAKEVLENYEIYPHLKVRR